MIGHWCNIVLNGLHQVRRKVMIQKTVFMRNTRKSRISIIFLSKVKVKVKESVTGPVWPRGLQEFRLPDFMTFDT